jgi:hypothetical protein
MNWKIFALKTEAGQFVIDRKDGELVDSFSSMMNRNVAVQTRSL